ncbi:hypothetical protein ABIB90_006337 [Bradyrhizobium sp. JR4.1]
MPAIFTATSCDDVTVTCTTRYVDTHGRGYRNFNQHGQSHRHRRDIGDGRFATDRQLDTTRAAQGAKSMLCPRDWRFLVPDVIRPFDRIRLQRSCIFLRLAEL